MWSERFCFLLLIFYTITPGSSLGAGNETTTEKVPSESAARILLYSQQWQKSPHANHKLANEINSGAMVNPSNAKCLLCHTSQGFIQWSREGFVPFRNAVNSSGGGSMPTVLEAGTALAPTCIACHDPQTEMTKDTGENDPMLRHKGKTLTLLGGFKIGKVGRGAICMVCHNNGKGLTNDATMPVMKSALAPHKATQADIFMGENFFFVKTGEPAYHINAIYNTCTACHMGSTYQGGHPTNHSFQATFEICYKCHNEFDPRDVKYKVLSGLEKLKATIDAAITDFAKTGLDAGKFSLLNMNEDEKVDEDYSSFSEGRISDVNIRYLYERQVIDVKVNGKSYLTSLDVLESKGFRLLDSVQGQIIAKAGWNLFMIDKDGSFGAHNHKFISEVIKETQKKLEETDFKVIVPLPK
jgi:hypothetical protein